MVGVVGLVTILLLAVSSTSATTDVDYTRAVELFQEYVRINTTTHNDLTEAVEFWRGLAEEVGVPINVYEYVEGYPVVVMKWEGADTTLDSVMLNSHMDVVPAMLEDGWTYDPFAAYMDENGDIYGRGTQDMKSVSIQYFEALRRIKAKGITLKRNVYMTLMPDEEVGAESGMIPFLKSEEFAAMHVGIEMDEGSSFPLPIIAVFYQDKVVWQIQVDCYAESAHGSTFPETNNTATGMCNNVVNRMFAFRDEQYEKSTKATVNNAGGYTSINLNRISGGTANNVIPAHVSLIFDIRLGTTVNEEEFDATLRQWITEAAAGGNITLTYISKNQQSPATIANSTNPYWTAIANGAASVGVTVLPTLPPGSTDARHVRNAGFPAFGLSPMPNTPLLLHSVNERVNVEVFKQGIDLFEQIIQNLANVPGDAVAADPSVYLYKTTDL